MYLSSIQQGIQSSHTQMELFVKYKSPSNKKDILFDWAEIYKTTIVLNGGFLSTMQEFLGFLQVEDNPYPFAEFYESEEALGGILTNIAIVLPEKIYKSSELLRNKIINSEFTITSGLPNVIYDETEKLLNEFGTLSEFEKELCSRLNNFRLAN
jgi:hypothetical protein